MQTGNLDQKFTLFEEHWSPRTIATLNGQQVILAKVKGEFLWHAHADEDEMFFVQKGSLTMEFRDRSVELNEGDFLVVPKGVEHRPVASEEAWLMLFEPLTTKHTGDVESERTKTSYPQI